MAKTRFNVISSVPAENEKEETIKEYHAAWKKTISNSNTTNFVQIFSSFKDAHLATLEPGALKLYLFFVFAASYQYGNSWYSIESAAKFFNTQTRTINNWIKILVDKNLIYREQNGKRTHTTYLLPYSNTLVKHKLRKDFKKEGQEVLDMLIKKLNDYDFLYGSIVRVFHFYQWKTDNKKKLMKEGIHWIVVITKRTDGVLTGHYYPLKSLTDYGVNVLNIEDSDIGTFESPFKFQDENIKGLEIKLTESNSGIILQLVEDLAYAEIADLDEHPKLQYGKIADFFPEEINEQEEVAEPQEEME